MSTRDEVLEFLDSAQQARARKLSYELRLTEVRAQAERMTKAMSPTPPGGGDGGNGQELIWAALADETTRYVEELKACGDVIDFVDEFIDRLKLPLINREILRLRHCNGLRWKQVQLMIRKVGYWYSEKYLWEMHKIGVKEAMVEYDLLSDEERQKMQELTRRFKDQREGFKDHRFKENDPFFNMEKESEKND